MTQPTRCPPRASRSLYWRCLLLILCVVSSRLVADTQPYSIDAAAEKRIQAHFHSTGLSYPPERVQLIALKQSRRVEVWVWQANRWRHLHDYPVLAASGHAGPKLREGDRQVPEGFYRIETLNPNSHFHLSLKLDYPNAFDWAHAMEDGRREPGSNIFIHGSAWSAGCLAMGNRGVEELFALAARIGTERMHVLIAPYDFRAQAIRVKRESPEWVSELYGYLKSRLGQFPLAFKHRVCEPECRVVSERLTQQGSLSELSGQ